MPIFGTRVVPQYRVRGLLALAGAMGLAMGAVGAPLLEWGTRWAWGRGSTKWDAVANIGIPVGLVALPSMIACLGVSRVTRRWTHVAAAGAVATVAAVFSCWVVGEVGELDGGYDASSWLMWQALVVFAMAGLFGAAIGIAVRWMVSGVLVRLVPQTGLLCWECGYDLGSDRIERCPECATPAKVATIRGPWLVHGWMGLQAFGRILLLASVSGMAGYVGYRLITVGLPVSRFYAGLTRNDRPRCHWVWTPATAVWPSQVWDGVATFKTIEGDARSRVMVYAFWPQGPKYGPEWVRMRVTLAAHPLSADSEGVWFNPPDEGTVGVCCDLNDAQADAVIRRGGLPTALAHRLVERADELGWKATATFGPVSKREVIDAQPFFEAVPTSEESTSTAGPSR